MVRHTKMTFAAPGAMERLGMSRSSIMVNDLLRRDIEIIEAGK